MPETPGLPGGPGFAGTMMTVYDSYRGVGISNARPLSTEEKGALIAAMTLAAGPGMILGRVGVFGSTKLAHLLWKGRFASVPFALSPGGGGPGVSPTSTEILLDWSDPRLRGYGPGHGY